MKYKQWPSSCNKRKENVPWLPNSIKPPTMSLIPMPTERSLIHNVLRELNIVITTIFKCVMRPMKRTVWQYGLVQWQDRAYLSRLQGRWHRAVNNISCPMEIFFHVWESPVSLQCLRLWAFMAKGSTRNPGLQHTLHRGIRWSLHTKMFRVWGVIQGGNKSFRTKS